MYLIWKRPRQHYANNRQQQQKQQQPTDRGRQIESLVFVVCIWHRHRHKHKHKHWPDAFYELYFQVILSKPRPVHKTRPIYNELIYN